MANYVKFILLGDERTGSNLLQRALAIHCNVVCAGELFNKSHAVRSEAGCVSRPIALADDPIDYLDTEIYSAHEPHIDAAGFKLFYSQARNDEWQDVWQYLRDSRVSVIHLQRRNLLDRYLSQKLAQQSDSWIHVNGQQSISYVPVTLNPHDCLQNFRTTAQSVKAAEKFFRSSPKIKVFYEDLCADFHAESRRIQEFLGLMYQQLSMLTLRQRHKKKADLIINYVELRREFELALSTDRKYSPKWLRFFDDQ